jgi:hypothetical protein
MRTASGCGPDDIALTLHPASLLQGELDIQALTVDRLELVRLPVSETDDDAGFRLPLALRLRQLVVARLLLAMLDPAPPPLAVTGSVRLADRQNAADLRLTVPGRDDDYRLTLAPTAQRGLDWPSRSAKAPTDRWRCWRAPPVCHCPRDSRTGR